MKGLFNYNSPLLQSILKLGDILTLNLLYILFSLPVFTIGAAQAGLYTGFRVMLDPEDDSSCTAAFIRGFKNGFTVITPVWLFLMVLTAIAGCCCIVTYAMGASHIALFALILLFICAIILTMAPIYHSRFSCTRLVLAKNAFYLFAAYPLQAVLIAVLMWMPLILFFFDAHLFVQIFLLLLLCWYGVAGLLSVVLIRKPFGALESQFYSTHDENGNPIPEEETTDE